MVIHSYCSYTYSSVGFQYGAFDVLENPSDGCLSDDKKSSIVTAAFDNGMIREMTGKYKGQYLYLIKKLQFFNPDSDDVGNSIFINMAFTFSDGEKAEFYSFLKNITVFSDDEKASLMGSMLIIDTKNKYGVRINNDKATAFYTEMTKDSEAIDSPALYSNDELTIMCISSKRNYSDEIARALDIDEEYLSQEESNLKCYHYSKKKIIPMNQKEKRIESELRFQPVAMTGNKRKALLLFIMVGGFIITVLLLIKTLLIKLYGQKTDFNP